MANKPIPTDTLSPLISATDPRSEMRTMAVGNIQMLEARRSVLEQQLAQLSHELDAVLDATAGLRTLEQNMTTALQASHTAALSEPTS